MEPGCPDGWARLATGCYLFGNVTGGATWDESEEMCAEFGGYLAEIKTEEEQEALGRYYEGRFRGEGCRWRATMYWMGGRDEEENGTWTWRHSAAPLNSSYTNWYQNIPLDGRCLMLMTSSDMSKDLAVRNFCLLYTSPSPRD